MRALDAVVLSAQYGGVGGTRIEPDIQGVAVFFVMGGFVAQQFGRIQRLPRFDAVLFDALRDLLHELDRAWMQLAGFLEIGRAHVRTPVTNAQLVCRLLLEKNKTTKHDSTTRTAIHNSSSFF